jgi:hypothetical protein
VEDVTRLLRALTPENVLVSYVSRDVATKPNLQTEKWYGMQFARA